MEIKSSKSKEIKIPGPDHPITISPVEGKVHLLAHFGKEGTPETAIPKISQETLAEMVGTTRSRVSSFTNRFRKFGFIQYNGELQVPQFAAECRPARLACRGGLLAPARQKSLDFDKLHYFSRAMNREF
jgi:hypothetical protein